MGNQQFIEVVVGDIDYDLNFTLKDAQSVPVNIANATIIFKAQSVSDYAVYFSGSMAATLAASGMCKYTVAATDFPIAGTYSAQVVVNYNSGEEITFTGIQVVAKAKLPVS